MVSTILALLGGGAFWLGLSRVIKAYGDSRWKNKAIDKTPPDQIAATVHELRPPELAWLWPFGRRGSGPKPPALPPAA